MAEMKEAVVRLAQIPSPVLILGESGSGKELVARELHQRSNRARKPYLTVNCAALPENLVESELFGHERGAFTGADRMRTGAFEAATGGSLFLDEIGELPLAAQAKLLRVLEEQTVTRLGGNRSIRIDTRVIAATNRDLDRETAEGRFREDLLYRLNVHVVRVPPLREHLSDLPELVDHFLALICDRFRVRRKRITPEALDLLKRYDWRRNNVRELRNVIEQMVFASEGNEITAAHVPGEITGGRGAGASAAGSRSSGETTASAGTFKDLKAAAEREIVLAALERNDWHITKTAAELGLADHASLLKVMKRHGLKRK
jgi:two-component system nitrogen regulation response regulator NtrX